MYHNKSSKQCINDLNSSMIKGLASNSVKKLKAKYGLNTINNTKKINPLKILLRQFSSFINYILYTAIIISLLIGESLDAIVICVILFLNGIFGFIQEFKAEKAIEALKKLSALKAKVIRDGKEKEIDSCELVPGDIIILETGSKVPADARILESSLFQADESSLTGESVPAKKEDCVLPQKTMINDMKNMVFMGSIVTKGHAKAIVTNTAMKTEIGKIATMVQQAEEKMTPLQLKLQDFGKWLGYVTIGICLVVFVVGILRDYFTVGHFATSHVLEMVLAAVALAVAAIPEGLPAIVTISLALGVRRMVKRNVLIRNLPAVETLGCTNVICSDKTGTLTKNEMTVKKIYFDSEMVTVSGNGYLPKGKFYDKNKKVFDFSKLDLILRIGALCNDARLNKSKNIWNIFGDPTEGSLLVSAKKGGLDYEKLNKLYPRFDEIAFDSDRKCMSTLHKINNKNVLYLKGGPDVILNKCSKIYENGKVRKITSKDIKKIKEINDSMASEALRVLAFAYKELPNKYSFNKKIESSLVFVGLQAMIDPPRENIKESIDKCISAGVRTVVITGDHKTTAIAIAKEIGLFKKNSLALTGSELDKMSDKKLNKMIDDLVICARVSPEHKVRILKALKKKGYVVAMTGDGVNDAPALKQSDIGVSMGVGGTDVAKEASDMILTDDNFSSIVSAVEEGRGIYDSIQKFVQYTLSSNLGEILLIFLAILIGWPLPLVAIQILWVNLLTDGLPGLALGMDAFSKDLMNKPPRDKKEGIITSEVIQNILIVGVVISIGTLFLFNEYGKGTDLSRSVAFTSLIIFQMFNVLTYRANNFIINPKTSKYLLGSVFISIILQFIVLYSPLNVVFKTVPISFYDWLYVILVSFSLYFILELRKVIIKLLKKHKIN